MEVWKEGCEASLTYDHVDFTHRFTQKIIKYTVLSWECFSEEISARPSGRRRVVIGRVLGRYSRNTNQNYVNMPRQGPGLSPVILVQVSAAVFDERDQHRRPKNQVNKQTEVGACSLAKIGADGRRGREVLKRLRGLGMQALVMATRGLRGPRERL